MLNIASLIQPSDHLSKINAARQRIQADNNDPGLYLDLGKLLLKHGFDKSDDEEAVANLQMAIAKGLTDNPLLYYLLAKGLNRLERNVEALTACEKALALSEDYQDALALKNQIVSNHNRSEQVAENYYLQGLACANTNFQETIKFYERAIALDPNHVKALLGLAALVKVKPQKQSYLDKVLKIEPDNEEALLGLAKLHSTQKTTHNKALRYVEQLLAKTPGQQEGLYLRAKIHLNKAEYVGDKNAQIELAAAEKDYLQLLESPVLTIVSPSNLYFELGSLYERWAKTEGDQNTKHNYYAKALEAYQKNLDIEPKNVRVRSTCIRICEALGDTEKQLNFLEKKAELEHTPGSYYQLAKFYFLRQKNFAQALQLCQKALELFPSQNENPTHQALALILQLQAQCYRGQNNSATALSSFQRALICCPNEDPIYTVILRNHIDACIHFKKYDLAKAQLRRLLSNANFKADKDITQFPLWIFKLAALYLQDHNNDALGRTLAQKALNMCQQRLKQAKTETEKLSLNQTLAKINNLIRESSITNPPPRPGVVNFPNLTPPPFNRLPQNVPAITPIAPTGLKREASPTEMSPRAFKRTRTDEAPMSSASSFFQPPSSITHSQHLFSNSSPQIKQEPGPSRSPGSPSVCEVKQEELPQSPNPN